jgi:hypothetical protein
MLRNGEDEEVVIEFFFRKTRRNIFWDNLGTPAAN